MWELQQLTAKTLEDRVKEIVDKIMKDCKESGKDPVVEAGHFIIDFYQSKIAKLEKKIEKLKKENAKLKVPL